MSSRRLPRLVSVLRRTTSSDRAFARTSSWSSSSRSPPSSRRCPRDVDRALSSASASASSSGSSSASDAVDIDAFLSRFKNHERTGVPAGAGVEGGGSAAFDLSRMHRLLSALGDPHLAGYDVIHVAGTKGKGSTVGFLAAILRAAGLNVGTYKSPHVHTVAERVRCGPGDAPATSGDAFVPRRHADAVLAADLAESGRITYFEALTALAFARFRDRGVTHAVVEVGVGGALDATNVFPASRLSAAIVTAVGGDHWDALGGSLGAIVRAKCGIARPNRPAFLGAQTSLDAECLALSELYRRGARLIGPADVDVRAVLRGAERDDDGTIRQIVDFAVVSDGSADGWSGDGDDVERVIANVRMPLLGPHQRENARLAVAAIAFLRAGGGGGPDHRDGGAPWPVDDEHVRRGLERAESPGCFEVIVAPAAERDERDERDVRKGSGSDWWLVADGAHTPESAAAATATAREVFPNAPKIAAVVAMAADKDHVGFLREMIRARVDVVVLTTVDISGGRERAAETETLAAAWDEASGTADDATTAASLEEGIDAARAALGDEGGGVVLVLGSLNTVAKARAWATGRSERRRG
jgi:folylpolyglutamate synthase/dihydrofolate synthase